MLQGDHFVVSPLNFELEKTALFLSVWCVRGWCVLVVVVDGDDQMRSYPSLFFTFFPTYLLQLSFASVKLET